MTDLSYERFLASKKQTILQNGFDVPAETINPKLFLFQRDIVRWALRLGKAAIFAECGLGKTGMQLEWAKHVTAHTSGKVLILAPLAVADQTVREGVKFNVPLVHVREPKEIGDYAIVITNYERLHKFNPEDFQGIVLDESSILKAFTGKTKRAIVESFRNTPYKLACTATPAPNDHLELGNHADFLDIMPSNEMISRWFINDTMSAGSYRLKNHAAKDFWRWLTSWAVCISQPKDMGDEYDIPDFELPELKIVEHRLPAPQESIDRAWASGRLMPDNNPSSTGLHKAKRESLEARVQMTQKLVSQMVNEPVIIWCDTNYEADALKAVFPDGLEVRGSHSNAIKEERLRAFSLAEKPMIITKPDIAGFGLNWQHCANQIFVGVSYSFEKTYQALRRSWRFGQTKPVNAHLIYAETEGNVVTVLNQKQKDFKIMQQEMNEAMREHGLFRDMQRKVLTAAQFETTTGKDWTLYLGDCVPVTQTLPDASIDFSIYSPPFANLYIYSDADADMGNSADNDEFFDHYEYLIKELYRVTLPGRLSAVHCKDLPAYMNRDGAAGLRDFPGEIIHHHEKHGWQYHSRVTIWKDPVIEMQRTKNHGLLHKNFTTRAEACRQGMPDYLLVFRKWPIDGGREIKQVREEGDYIGLNPPQESELNGNRKGHENYGQGHNRQANYSIAVWQRYASPVWYDIDQTNVLNFRLAKDSEDEKHICPLQLDVIARSVDLWSMKGETVFSPFAGVGSEGVESIRMGRKFIGIELKESYYQSAIKFLKQAERESNQIDLFQWAETQAQERG